MLLALPFSSLPFNPPLNFLSSFLTRTLVQSPPKHCTYRLVPASIFLCSANLGPSPQAALGPSLARGCCFFLCNLPRPQLCSGSGAGLVRWRETEGRQGPPFSLGLWVGCKAVWPSQDRATPPVHIFGRWVSWSWSCCSLPFFMVGTIIWERK